MTAELSAPTRRELLTAIGKVGGAGSVPTPPKVNSLSDMLSSQVRAQMGCSRQPMQSGVRTSGRCKPETLTVENG